MTVRVDVEPALLEWAVARSGRSEEELWTKSFPRERFDQWRTRERKPTVRQLEEFAAKTHTPFGFLLLPEPPQEAVPLADFRAAANGVFSVDLRDTIYECQARRDWYENHRFLEGGRPYAFVGSASIDDDPVEIAGVIAETIRWTPSARRSAGSWSGALAAMRERVEAIGILVVITSVVRGNPHRRLDRDEFKGFALAEPQASLIFVNGADFESSKIFTLAHELAHVWLGAPGVSDLDLESVDRHAIERWCNRVAAELLVPARDFAERLDPDVLDAGGQLGELARHFRVSEMVILGRMREEGHLDWATYLDELQAARERAAEAAAERGSGGNFYNSKPVQLSKLFVREIIASTLEGRTSYKDAFDLLSIKKQSTFDRLGAELGVT